MLDIAKLVYHNNPRKLPLEARKGLWQGLQAIAKDAAHAKKDSSEFLATLDVDRTSMPVRALLKAILTEQPKAQACVPSATLRTIMDTKPLPRPFELSEEPHHIGKAYADMNIVI